MSEAGKSTVRCPRCDKAWPSTTAICPNDGTTLHASTAVSYAPWSSNTEINAPFQGSLTDRASVDSFAPMDSARGSVAPNSLGPTNMIPSRPPRVATNELLPDTRVGDYEIEGKIGEGAMGAVFRAVHPTIGKRVAVKIMNSKLCGDFGAVERFTREAKTVAAIRHPGIVDIFSFGSLPDGRAYLIMEWLDGASLAARMRHGCFTQDEALDVLSQIARALEAAHDEGVIHRDLKPDNVFLQRVAKERPIVKILDFGLAKLVNDDSHVKTQTGQLLGTPVYMSPEQCKGKGVDYRTDIYALGCMAYELLCGRVPFDADNVAELMAAHLSEPPPRPRSLEPDLPPTIDELLFAMIAKDPAKRPKLSEVRQTIATLRGSGFPTPIPGQLIQRQSTRAFKLAVVAVLIAGGIAIGVGLAMRGAVGVARRNTNAIVDSGTATAVGVDASVDALVPIPVEQTSPSPAVEKPPTPVKKPIKKPSTKPPAEKAPVDNPVPAEKPDPNTTTINPFKRKPAP